ncbi:MAG: hydrogenase iron-sulfur subunit [Anaerolineae bacterium]
MTQETASAVSVAATEGHVAGSFEPEITAFTCIYCGFMSADTAGALHFSYPANVKLLKLPCTGKVDVEYILKAFENGADGVYVVACPLGNCHHLEGNVRATKRVAYAKKLLDEIGLGGDRVEIFYMSGGQGGAFAEAARTMTERIRKMGPNPLKHTLKGC